jgi:hypothetical protein
MRLIRVFQLGIALCAATAAGALVGCDTGAAGIEACRQIEAKRCELAPVCFGDPAGTTIQTEDQVKNCQTFYQDHCLVGLESATDADQDQIDGCVAAIEAAAACKTAKAKTIGVCDNPPKLRSGASGMTPCEILAAPEHLSACKFVESSTTAATTAAATSGSGGGGTGGGA